MIAFLVYDEGVFICSNFLVLCSIYCCVASAGFCRVAGVSYGLIECFRGVFFVVLKVIF